MRLRRGRSRAALAGAGRASFSGALLAGLCTALGLAGCAPTQLAGGPTYRPIAPAAPVRHAAPPVGSGVSSLANLPGWREEDHIAALAAVRTGCPLAASSAMQAVCGRLRGLAASTDAQAQAFLEANFRPMILPGPGLLTAYYAPEYPARQTPDDAFSAALRPRPADLVSAPSPSPGGRPAAQQMGEDGQAWPYPDRAGIELTPATDALAYLRPEDLFFLQIQGSGVLLFPDGRRMRAAYAADNGRPFVAIAGEMVRRRMVEPDRASGSAIRAWLHAHAGAQAQSLMDLDPRYIFFSLTPDDGREPAGAAGVALTPGRAIAVDPTWHAYGQPFWIDAAAPVLNGAVQRYRRLVVALDTGSAIRGDVRADLYLGTGERAGTEAGRVRHTLLLVKLEPLLQPAAGP